MANTVDILGEQETLDRLITHSLDSIEDDRVTSIRQQAFFYNDTLESANFPNVVTIGGNAFRGNTELKTVNLPNATTLGKECFNNDIKLQNINIPKAIKIDAYSFSNCTSLNNIYIPNASTIGSNAFSRCYNLKSAVFSSAITILQSNVFNSCFSLGSIDLQNITTLAYSGLPNTGIGTIVLPKCTSLGTNILTGMRTSTVDLYKQLSIPSSSFANVYSLVHIILRDNAEYPLSNINALTNTPITDGIGWIYVPSDLVDTYKTASNWSTYANQIVSIDEYPKAIDGETITDTWDEIFQAEENDTYKTKYNVGDTKYLIINGTYVLMQIIAFDRDILSSDGVSTAKITWLSKSLSFLFPMNLINNTELSNWKDCSCRKFLNDVIYEQIPENVRNKIVAVNKSYAYITNTSTINTSIVSDKLWIPSYKEINSGSSLVYENTGIDYLDFFTDNSIRAKKKGLLQSNNSNNFDSWWTRTGYNNNHFIMVGASGTLSNSDSTSPRCITLGFCT